MRKFAYILLLFFICSCQQKKSNVIQCPNNIRLTTSSDESIERKVAFFVDDYEPYVHNIKQQCPLYRCIQGNDYTIYVAMPVQLTYDVFKESCLFADMVCVDSIFTDSTVYRYWKADNKDIAQVLYVKDKSSILIVGVPINQNSLSLTYDALVKRIETKH